MQKLIFFSLLSCLLTGNLVAQDTVHTLIRPSKLNYLGLYVAPEFQYGQSNSAFTSFAGGSAMLLLNKRLALGVTAQQSLSETFSPNGVSPLVLQSAFGGGKLEYTLHPDAAFHLTFPLVVGVGEVRADSLHTHDNGVDHEMHGDGHDFERTGMDGTYFLIQPGVQVEVNLLRYAKLFAGANYRITSNMDSASTLPSDALQGLSLNVGLKVGWFDFRLRHKKMAQE